jgi:hypothetical protein
MTETSRLLCAERGHKWSDGNYFQEKASPKLGIKYVWVLRIECERDGCIRRRIDYVMPKTFELINRYYEGDIEKLPRQSKTTIRGQLIKRSK